MEFGLVRYDVSKHPLVKPGSNVRWDGRYCLLNGILETSVARFKGAQGGRPRPTVPMTGGQPPAELHSSAATCGGVGVTEIAVLWSLVDSC